MTASNCASSNARLVKWRWGMCSRWIESAAATTACRRRVRRAKWLPSPGRSNAMKRTARHARSSRCRARTRSLMAWKRPRPSHSSPSIGCAGQPRVKPGGASMRVPLRVHSARPSQRARTPSSFSLTRKLATSMSPATRLASIGAGAACNWLLACSACCGVSSSTASRVGWRSMAGPAIGNSARIPRSSSHHRPSCTRAWVRVSRVVSRRRPGAAPLACRAPGAPRCCRTATTGTHWRFASPRRYRRLRSG